MTKTQMRAIEKGRTRIIPTSDAFFRMLTDREIIVVGFLNEAWVIDIVSADPMNCGSRIETRYWLGETDRKPVTSFVEIMQEC